MVIGDLTRASDAGKSSFVASPTERFSATAIDLLVVILPLSGLLVAPARKQLSLSAILSEPHNVFIFGLITAIGIFLLAVSYKAIATTYFGFTFGQRILGLTVVDRATKSLVPLYSAIVRSVFWCLGPVTLGFTWIGVFTSEQRQTLHDRLAETIVLSRRKYDPPRYHLQERTFARAYAFSVGFLFLTVFLVLVAAMYKGLEGSQLLSSQLPVTCNEIDAAVLEWPNDNDGESAERLEIAMTLFAAGQISKNCLSTEVDYHFQQGFESPLSYLASSFVHSEDPGLSDRYLRTACKMIPDSESCKMSNMIEFWSDENWSEIDRLIGDLKDTENSFIGVWIVRHLVNQSDFDKAIQKIEGLRGYPFLSSFLSVQFVKAKWGDAQDSSSARLAEALSFSLSEEEAFELDAWLCHQQLARSCQFVTDHTCDRTAKRVAANERFLQLPAASLALTKTQICEEGKINLSKLAEKYMDSQVKEVAELISQLNSNDRSQAVDRLRQMYKSPETDSMVAQFAMQALIDEVDDLTEVSDLLHAWTTHRTSVDWVETGRRLLKRLTEEEVFNEAFQVGKRLVEKRQNDIDLAKNVAILAFRSNHLDAAAALVARVQQADALAPTERVPASTNLSEVSFEDVASQMKARKKGNAK